VIEMGLEWVCHTNYAARIVAPSTSGPGYRQVRFEVSQSPVLREVRAGEGTSLYWLRFGWRWEDVC
jgi:hypothetical protein